MRIWPILLVCPFMTGCLAFAYPSVAQTPAIAVKEPDVKAFRVTEDSTFFGLMGFLRGPQRLEELSMTNGEIPAHRAAYCKYWFMAFPIGGYNSHCETVRLYRRGYETVTIESKPWMTSWWQTRPEQVVWKKADTLEAREKAILHLYQPSTSMMVTHREKNAFVADEYLLLANSPLAAGPEYVIARKGLVRLAEMARDGKLENFEPRVFASPKPESTQESASVFDKTRVPATGFDARVDAILSVEN